MTQLQVLLKGENRKLHILICVVLLAVVLILLETWQPGTIASIPSAIKNGLVRIYDYGAEVIESLKMFISETAA